MIQAIKCFFGFHGRILDQVVLEADPEEEIEEVVMPCCEFCDRVFQELS